MTDEDKTPDTDEDITEDTLDRPAAEPAKPANPADMIEAHMEATKAAAREREATRRARLAKKAECDADRTLAVALLYEAIHRAEHFAHEIVYTEKLLAKFKALAEKIPEHDYTEAIATIEVRKEIAEEALPALLDLRAHRKRLLDLAELAVELQEPSTEELWTMGAAGALAVSPYLLQWHTIMAKVGVDGADAVAADPGSDPIPAGPTP